MFDATGKSKESYDVVFIGTGEWLLIERMRNLLRCAFVCGVASVAVSLCEQCMA